MNDQGMKSPDMRTMWACDFECTTDVDYEVEGKVRCYLWHARNLKADAEQIGYDVKSFVKWLEDANDVKWCVFHNLKYDGSFILDYCLRTGWTYGGANKRNTKSRKTRVVETVITDLGQWMTMSLKFGDHIVRFMDSAKKFPSLSLQQIADLYHIEGKSSLDVYRRREEGTPVTQEEIDRVRGDTRILAVAMRDIISKGMYKLTMASDAKQWFAAMFNQRCTEHHVYARDHWKEVFPEIDQEHERLFRRGYFGGWVYLNERYRGEIVEDVHVYDVNSMFPAQMIKPMPFGPPRLVRKQPTDGWWIVRFTTEFHLRDGKLPFLHAKHSIYYGESEFITDSDGPMELVLCCTDYQLFEECYESEYEIGFTWWKFQIRESPFIDYVNFWMSEKKRAKNPSQKATAKRYLNSLYGKLAESPDKMAKIPHYSWMDNQIMFDIQPTQGRGWYLPMGMAITAYARQEILHFAMAFGDRLIYSDTDSVHVLGEEVPEGMPIDPKELGMWKHESVSERARYVGAKKYVHVNVRDPADPEKFEAIAIACAGMPTHCKEGVTLENFVSGAKFPGKLAGKTVPGGYVLIETEYTVRVH